MYVMMNDEFEQLLKLSLGEDDEFSIEQRQLLDLAKCMRSKPGDINAGEIKISSVSSKGMISGTRIFNLPLLEDRLKNDKSGLIGMKDDSKWFGNSVNVKVRASLDRKFVNIIIFQNGRMTLTGADTIKYGETCMKKLVAIIFQHPDTFYNVDPDSLELLNNTITTINARYDIGFKINQLSLYEILVNEYPYLVTFNPESYRGTSMHFMWHEKCNHLSCSCIKNCLSRKQTKNNGSGVGNDSCREITCAVFHSGIIIISGSASIKQMQDIYNELNKMLSMHYSEIVSLSITDF